jgi:hypothetical protein
MRKSLISVAMNIFDDMIKIPVKKLPVKVIIKETGKSCMATARLIKLVIFG